MKNASSSDPTSPTLPPKAPYSCCSGVAYFSRAMQLQGSKPICLGMKHVKEGVLQSDDAQNLPSGTQDYQFVCIGFSAHPDLEGADGSAAGARTLLPYCEGVEVLSYTHADQASAAEPEADAAEATATAAAGVPGRPSPAALQQRQQPRLLLQERAGGPGASAPTSGAPRSGTNPAPSAAPDPEPGRRSFAERFWARAEVNVDSMHKLLRNEGTLRLRSFESMQHVSQRFWQVGAQNSARMVAAAGLVRSTIAERCDVLWQAVSERTRK